MKIEVTITFLIVAIPVILSVGDHTFLPSLDSPEWCYNVESCNESTWKSKCSSKCHQSPINLPSDLTVIHSHHETIRGFPKSNLTFSGFQVDFRGHTIQVKPGGEPFRFSRKFHSDSIINYTLHGLDIHWGSNNSFGSEHTMDGYSFAGEVHLAFHDESRFSMADADDAEAMLNKTGDLGILIIGVFLDVAQNDSRNVSNWMERITEQVGYLQNNNPINVRDTLDLTGLFEGSLAYRYPGSFTTPSCRGVEWFVLRRPVLVPIEHMEALRSAYVDELPVDGNNYRLTKPYHPGDINLVRFDYV